MNLRHELRTAMDNAMCGDICYDMNCPKCANARLQAICTTVHIYLAGALKPLNPLVAAGFIPPETVRLIKATMEELKRDPYG